MAPKTKLIPQNVVTRNMDSYQNEFLTDFYPPKMCMIHGILKRESGLFFDPSVKCYGAVAILTVMCGGE